MTNPSPIGPATSTWLMPAAAATTAPAGDVVDQVDEDAPRVGLLRRLQLTEPVRLYLYSALLVVLAGLQLAGYLTGEWRDYAATSAAVLLAVGGTGEVVRSAVYSPAGVIRAARAAASAVSR